MIFNNGKLLLKENRFRFQVQGQLNMTKQKQYYFVE